MPTDFAKLNALYPLSTADLPRQWVLTRNRAEIPDGWTARSLGGWHLIAHPDAHVCDARAADGTPIGWIVEPLVYLTEAGGLAPEAALTLPVPPGARHEDLERILYGRDEHGRISGNSLEGMWTAILFLGTCEEPVHRVYVAPTHSVVYSRDYRIVATTPNLIPELQRDEALSRGFDPLARNSYYTFGLTAFVGVSRLLPNHYLDLDNFGAVRFWPRDRLEPIADGGEGAEAIVEHSRRLIRALIPTYASFRVFLSAGRDSRAVLSLLRPLLDEGAVDILLSTTVGPDIGRRTDLQGARRLARIANLSHEIVQRGAHRSDAAAVMEAFARIGEAKATPILSTPQLKKRQSQDERFILAGMGGETGRAFFWKNRVADEPVTPDELAHRTRAPAMKEVTEAAAGWLESLPAAIRSSPPEVLDLAYVEQRLGCWDSPTRYLFPGRPRVSSPMASGLNIETMLRLPRSYRAAGILQRDMVAYGWPELLSVPFNEPSGFLRLEAYVTRWAGRVLRRLKAG